MERSAGISRARGGSGTASGIGNSSHTNTTNKSTQSRGGATNEQLNNRRIGSPAGVGRGKATGRGRSRNSLKINNNVNEREDMVPGTRPNVTREEGSGTTKATPGGAKGTATSEGKKIQKKTNTSYLKESYLPVSFLENHWRQVFINLGILKSDGPIVEEECVLCAMKSEIQTTSPDCNDCPAICLTCALKSQVMEQNKACRFCSITTKSRIIFTLDTHTKESISQLDTDQLTKVPITINPLLSGLLTTHPAISQVIECLVKTTTCWAESCASADVIAGKLPDKKHTYRNKAELRQHFMSQHHASLCNLCSQIKNSSLLIERVIYPQKALALHRKKGDPERNIDRHPYCRWCDRSYADDEALILHQNKEHQQCTLCKKNVSDAYYGGNLEAVSHMESTNVHEADATIQERSLNRGQGLSLGYLNPEDTKLLAVFKDITELIRHNLMMHYPCPSPDCCLVTFKDYYGAKTHFDTVHRGSNMFKCIEKLLYNVNVKYNQCLLYKAMNGELTKVSGKNVKPKLPNINEQEADGKRTDVDYRSVITALIEEIKKYLYEIICNGIETPSSCDEFEWTPEQGLPEKVGLSLIEQNEQSIRNLYPLRDDLGALFVPMPLLENISKLVTMYNQLHGSIEGVPSWTDAIDNTFSNQSVDYLLLIQLYLEVCQDILSSDYLNIKDKSTKTTDINEEFPSLGGDRSKDTDNQSNYGPKMGNSKKSTRPVHHKYDLSDAFPDLSDLVDTNSVMSSTSPITKVIQPSKEPGNWGLKAKGKAKIDQSVFRGLHLEGKNDQQKQQKQYPVSRTNEKTRTNKQNETYYYEYLGGSNSPSVTNTRWNTTDRKTVNNNFSMGERPLDYTANNSKGSNSNRNSSINTRINNKGQGFNLLDEALEKGNNTGPHNSHEVSSPSWGPRSSNTNLIGKDEPGPYCGLHNKLVERRKNQKKGLKINIGGGIGYGDYRKD